MIFFSSLGRALEEGRQLLTSHGDVLIDDIRPYVERSIERDERLLQAEQLERDEEQRKELEHERQLREGQERVTKRTTAGLIAASLLLLIAAAQARTAGGSRIAANTAVKLEASYSQFEDKNVVLAMATQTA